MRNEVLKVLQEKVSSDQIPGISLLLSHKQKIVIEEAVGYSSIYPNRRKLELDTIFDLASLTKVIATLPSILKLLDLGLIKLNDSISRFIPEMDDKGSIRVSDLLTHKAGLPAAKRFYKLNMDKDKIFKSIYKEELINRPGQKVIYSDIGYMLLYKAVELVTGSSFDNFVQKEIFDPLEMKHTSFNPEVSDGDYAATEYCDKTGTYKCGVVHDRNAEAMGGVSGHAGLFSNLSDLRKFATMIENNGSYRTKTILSEEVIQLSRRNFSPPIEAPRGLGWELQNMKEPLFSCGNLFSEDSYGHTGFTGTSIWFDPTVELNVILLTNRIHIGRTDDIKYLRNKIHNIIRTNF